MLTGEMNLNIVASDGDCEFTGDHWVYDEELRSFVELLISVIPSGFDFTVEELTLTAKIKILNPAD
jgi:hypothetical protein